MCEAHCGRDWSGEVVVRLNQPIRADFGWLTGQGHLEAEAGEHPGCANQHGAISVYVEATDHPRETLGAKPAEIAWWRYADSSERYVWSTSQYADGGCGWVVAADELRRLQAVLDCDDDACNDDTGANR
jgi:hypothetical protein